MADPLSVVAGAVGISAATLHRTRRLYEFIDSIQGVPCTIKVISADLHAFSAILESMHRSLQSKSLDERAAEKIRAPLKICDSTT